MAQRAVGLCGGVAGCMAGGISLMYFSAESGFAFAALAIVSGCNGLWRRVVLQHERVWGFSVGSDCGSPGGGCGVCRYRISIGVGCFGGQVCSSGFWTGVVGRFGALTWGSCKYISSIFASHIFVVGTPAGVLLTLFTGVLFQVATKFWEGEPVQFLKILC